MSFTEEETQEYYDNMNSIYTSFWDKRGSVHWGIFTNKSDSLEVAYDALNEKYLLHLDANKSLLDVACGNGFTDLELTRLHNFSINGIDLSGERIKCANRLKKNYSSKVQNKVKFIQGSATNLPFDKNSFQQVMSQSSFYHVHDKEKLLLEVHRVLDTDGLLVFDDLFKPKRDISDDGLKHVYQRLLFDTDFSFDSYKTVLSKKGFTVLCSEDLTNHLFQTYFLLKERLQNDKTMPKRIDLINSYEGTLKAIDNNELGWGFYACQKI